MINIQITIGDDGVVKTDLSSNTSLEVSELENYLRPLVQALQTYIVKNSDYGSSWKIEELKQHESLMTAVVYLVKGKRICSMLEKEDGKISEKYYQQLKDNGIDIINYANFFLQTMNKYKPEKRTDEI